jgi:hypothetical protein
VARSMQLGMQSECGCNTVKMQTVTLLIVIFEKNKSSSELDGHNTLRRRLRTLGFSLTH